MPLLPTDLNNVIKTQKLTDDHVVLLVYQLCRGLKVKLLMSGYSCDWANTECEFAAIYWIFNTICVFSLRTI